MLQLKTILLTTDLSENAQAAAPYARDLARKFGGSIKLVHVYEDANRIVAMPGEGAVAFDWIHAIRIERKVRLNFLAEEMARIERLDVAPVFLEGTPVTEILNAAAAHRADCIVMATHGRTGLSHFIMGSVTERIVQLSPCAVLTVRPEKMKDRS